MLYDADVDVNFNPRSPHGERRAFTFMMGNHKGNFNPRSPHGERRGLQREGGRADSISIHAPRTGSDGFEVALITEGYGISIHAPRTGSDALTAQRIEAKDEFQSTLPARGATSAIRNRTGTGFISIHAPRTGSDMAFSFRALWRMAFQSTLPARGATDVQALLRAFLCISIHAPRTGSDWMLCWLVFNAAHISIHAPRTGSDSKPFTS